MIQTLKLYVSVVLTPTTCQDKIVPSNARIEIVQNMSNVIQSSLSNEKEMNDDGDDWFKQHSTKITLYNQFQKNICYVSMC